MDITTRLQRLAAVPAKTLDREEAQVAMSDAAREIRRLRLMVGPFTGERKGGLPVCSATAKRAYPNEDAARSAVAHAILHASPGRQVPQRAYECEHCGRWHLTSQWVRVERSTG